MYKAVVFDWAGTIVDFGSLAPMDAFVRSFEAVGVRISIAQAREPMGSAKRDHVRQLLALPDIAAQWRAAHGHAADESSVDLILSHFVPMTQVAAADRAMLIPGAMETFRTLRAQGIRIGTTTGYTRAIMERVLPRVAEQGFVPESLVCSDDLAEGRPGPLGIYKTMVELAVYPPKALIKVDDTAPGLAEGRNAGCLTVGVALSGNAVGLTQEELAACSQKDVAHLRDAATITLRAAGADHVIDTVADLPELISRL